MAYNLLNSKSFLLQLTLSGCLLGSLSGCFSKKTTTKQSTTTTPTNTQQTTYPYYTYPNPTPTVSGNGGTSYGTGNEPGVSDAGQTIEYYKLRNPPIVVHGANSGQVVWSSETNMPSGIPQSILTTDSRLNVRVIPRQQYFGVDSRGVVCQYQPRPYQKLQVGVQIRKKESATASAYYLFDNVAVDGASRVHEFSVPDNTNHPLIIEILNVKWDYTCTYYAQQGYPNVEGYCPWDKVWNTECVQIELQFSTDTTTDIPGARTF